MPRSVGIDLGTTNSVVGLVSRGRPLVVPNPATNLEWTPSLVGIDPRTDAVVVGRDVETLVQTEPRAGLHSFKRLMGRTFADEAVQRMIAERRFLYEIVEHPDRPGEIGLVIRGRILTPAEASAEVLRALRREAAENTGDEVSHAVVTVPAYFRDPAILATREAGRLAGLVVKHVMPEPTAAAVAYGLDTAETAEPRYVVVYDFGGGTFDLSILLAVSGSQLQVLGVDGDNFLGGDDLDWEIARRWDAELQREHRVSILDGTGISPASPQPVDALRWRLKFEARAVKEALATSPSRSTTLPALVVRDDGTVLSPSWTLARDDLSTIAAPYLERTFTVVDRALEAANITRDDIGAVVVVGGSSRLPGVLDRLRWTFPKAEILNSINPMTVVGIGATVQTRVAMPWTCEACGRANDATDARCVGCGAPAVAEQHECADCGALYAATDVDCPNPLCRTRIVRPAAPVEALSHDYKVQLVDGWHTLIRRGEAIDPSRADAARPSDWMPFEAARSGQSIDLPIGQAHDDPSHEPETVAVFRVVDPPGDLQVGEVVKVRLHLNGSRLATAEADVRGRLYATTRLDPTEAAASLATLEAEDEEDEADPLDRLSWYRFLASGDAVIPDYSRDREVSEYAGAVKSAAAYARELADQAESAAKRGDSARYDELYAELEEHTREYLTVPAMAAIAMFEIDQTEDMDARRDLKTGLDGLSNAFAHGDTDDVIGAMAALSSAIAAADLPGAGDMPQGTDANLLRRFRGRQ